MKLQKIINWLIKEPLSVKKITGVIFNGIENYVGWQIYAGRERYHQLTATERLICSYAEGVGMYVYP